jgi:hypothetical protein
VQAFENLDTSSYKNFLAYHGIKIKDDEVNDVESLINTLNDREGIKSIFSQFYVGFTIFQIDKEFDLLRFGEESIINIEIKSSSTEDEILKQLKRNRYYLNFIDKEIHNYTFVSSENKLYKLNNIDTLEEVDFIDLAKLLYEQRVINIDNINKLFNPSDYLVSPFNSTENFIDNKYFLTQHQESIKNGITSLFNDDSKAQFFSITGDAGSGKTLLIYDIAKNLIDNKQKVLIIHCAPLNYGQGILNSEDNWKIIEIKDYQRHKLSDYDLIIVDEAQRIYPKQLEYIKENINTNNGNCVFSYDKLQTLSSSEDSNDIDGKINNISLILTYNLKKKIRTNKEIASFIKMFFDIRKNLLPLNKDNIEISYFNNETDTKDFLEVLNEQDWEIIRFTPSRYDSEYHEKYCLDNTKTSHKIAGQEFDNVVIVLDNYFSYDKISGKLIYSGSSHYDIAKMLFQNITRTRTKLHIVIINNNEILNRCLSILK